MEKAEDFIYNDEHKIESEYFEGAVFGRPAYTYGETVRAMKLYAAHCLEEAKHRLVKDAIANFGCGKPDCWTLDSIDQLKIQLWKK